MTTHKEKIYSVRWTGSIWWNGTKKECIEEAKRLRNLHPEDDTIKVIEKVVIINEIEF